MLSVAGVCPFEHVWRFPPDENTQEYCHTLGVLLKANRFISHSNAGAGMENANVYRS